MKPTLELNLWILLNWHNKNGQNLTNFYFETKVSKIKDMGLNKSAKLHKYSKKNDLADLSHLGPQCTLKQPKSGIFCSFIGRCIFTENLPALTGFGWYQIFSSYPIYLSLDRPSFSIQFVPSFLGRLGWDSARPNQCDPNLIFPKL